MRGARAAAVVVSCALAYAATGCGASARPTLEVEPARALFDAPVEATVGGVEAGDEVALVLRATGSDGSDWSARTTLRAGAGGTARPDVIRLVDALSTGEDGDYLDPTSGFTMTLTARVGDGPEASAELTREAPTDLRTRDLTVAADGVLARLYLPAERVEDTSAVVVLGGSEGGLSPTLQASMLAAHGHPAMALAYFDGPGLPADLDSIPLEYVARAVRLLARQPGVDPDRMVLWGSSRGSEAAVLTAARYPDLVRDVVATVPAALAGSGLPDRSEPAWSFRGRPVPRDVLPVERVAGRVLLVCGGQDETWPSCPNADTLVARSRDLDGPAPTLLRYPDAGHYVGGLVPHVPTTELGGVTAAGEPVTSGGSVRANQAARADAWPRVLDWLDAS